MTPMTQPKGSVSKNPLLHKVRDFLSRDTTNESLEHLLEDFKSGRVYDTSIFSRQNHKNLSSLRDVPGMVEDPIIKSCLAVIMEAAFQTAEDQRYYWIQSPYESITKELNAFHTKVDMDLTVLTVAYNLLLWGNFAFKHKFNEDYQLELVMPVPDFTKVTPIIVSNQTLGYMVGNEYKYPYEYSYAQLQHFKDYGGNLQNSFYSIGAGDSMLEVSNEFIYSPSYLSTSAKPWKSVNIIEDALILNRMDQSNYYRVISVDVGDKVYSKSAIKILNYYRNIFKKVRRVSYDSDGMSSKGTGHEYEVIVPRSTRQDVGFHDVGGKVEVRAVKDLDLQYQKLFASLRVHPSRIGYTEDVPSSLGEGPTVSWDKNFARTVKTLVFSVFKAIKDIDYTYLRSRGYNVTKQDWTYKTSAISILEDQERQDLLTQSVKTTKDMVELFGGMELKYNKPYLIKQLLGTSLAAASVDIDKLLATSDPASIQSSDKKSLIKDDLIALTSTMETAGIIDIKEKTQINTSINSSVKREKLASPELTMKSGKVHYEYLKSGSGLYPNEAKVIFDDNSVIFSPKRGVETHVADSMQSIPVTLPVKYIIADKEELDVVVDDIEMASMEALTTVLIDEAGAIHLNNKHDLLTYLYMNRQGYKEVLAKTIRIPKRGK